MFDPYCSTCQTRVLVGFRRLRSLENTPGGIVLRFTCHCGGEAVLTTGRRARTDHPETPRPEAMSSAG
jgi:hypothetical protein